MAAYAALVSLLNNLQQMMNHPRIYTCLENKQIQPLMEKVRFLLNFMERNNYGGGSKEGGDLERQIASAAHTAEDVIESHVVDQIHAEMNLGSSFDLQQIIEDMDAVIEKAAELEEKLGGLREEEQEQATCSRSAAAPLMETGESSTRMVGLDDELNQLVDDLTGNSYPSSLHALSIVGMGGMGKTTLAKNVYQNKFIISHFKLRSWATVSVQHSAQNILCQFLSSLGISTTSGNTVDSLGKQLRTTLWGKKYLIILDDVRSLEAWDSVRRFFPDNGNKSRVVLTTRMSDVAKACCGSSVFSMKFLDKDKSWELFCEKKLFLSKDDPDHVELRDVGKEIVRLCKGLALLILVIGGLLLKSPRTVGFWKGVAKDLDSIPDFKAKKQETLDVLTLSYSHLPPHLKPCFLYMGVFKKAEVVLLDNLQTLKVAVNLRLSEEVCQIIPNIKKLRLIYAHDLLEYDDSLIECLCNLNRLKKLESLNLSITSSRGPTPDPEMNWKLIQFPNSLNKLSLHKCQLHWDDLTIIGSLPLLQVLSLEFQSVSKGKRWRTNGGQFRHLKFLKIDTCNLYSWDANNSHFPALEKLIIRDLWYLEKIPLDLGNISPLKLIRVDMCSESAAVSAVKIKKDQLENLGDDCHLQIQLKIFYSHLQSFKERLEREGLTLDSFQLEI